jgi:hypothetical protein
MAILALASASCGGPDELPPPPVESDPPPVDTSPPPVTEVGPPNSWPHASTSDLPPGGLTGEGWDDGQICNDFVGVDQFGDSVSLWQFYGRATVVSIVQDACGPCRTSTDLHEDFWVTNGALPVMAITVLVATPDGAPATAEQAAAWAGFQFATHPVLADTTGALSQWASYGIPGAVLIDWDMRVIESRFDPPDYNQAIYLAQDAPG